MKNKLIIGRIKYANLFPIFHYLDRECNSGYQFVEGVPSRLNAMLRSGELDISWSSSIEYLKNKKQYRILPWLAVSSLGPIKSILLFSRLPIQELGGKTIAVTSDSETSVALLKIVLNEFFSLKCRYETTSLRSVKNILSSYPAVLHIGDTAMIEEQKVSMRHELGRPHAPELFIYDLGELWAKETGLPFVYALWVVNIKSLFEKSDLVKQLSLDLIKAKEYAKKHFPSIAEEAPQRKWISKKKLVDYWKIISYDYTDKHVAGLNLFEQYINKYKL